MAATTIVPRIPISNSIAANSNPRRRRRSNSFGFPVAIRATALSHNSALLRAAKHTVDTYIENGMVVGLGSGQASAMAIQYLGGKLRSGALKDLVGIPMSVGCASEAVNAGIRLNAYGDTSHVDFAFNDADVMEQGTLVAVIGRRKLGKDESMIQEKRILNAASKLVFMVTEEQYKIGPDGSIPVLIQPLGWMDTAEELDDLFLGDAEVWRRSSMGGAGPTGGDFPLVTKEGHHILDLIFTSPISLGEVAETLDNVGGVVDHGVILKYPCTAVIASENGVRIVDKLPATIEE
ncbi:Probable ribose-5-phosphate isomerase 4, chloroplastic [Linum perenne]